MLSLIDADLVAYRVAAAYENEDIGLAIHQADGLVNRLCDETEADTFRLFLTGSSNFRYSINPQYKANRTDVPRPRHLEPLREHLIVNYGATLSEGCEADDLMGIAQTVNNSQGTESCIVSLDKDLLMVPGKHYSWEISGKTKTGMWTREAIWRTTLPVDGLRFFYGQLILGDKADNVLGYDGLMRPKIPQKLQWMFERLESLDDEISMYEFVLEHYQDFDGMAAKERMIMNASCLYILQKEDERWVPPGSKETEGAPTA